MSLDRRRNPRLDLQKEGKGLHISIASNDRIIKAKLIDLSIAGVGLSLESPVSRDETVKIQIVKASKKLIIPSKVSWTSVSDTKKGYKHKAGFEFQSMTDDRVFDLARLVGAVLAARNKKQLLDKISDLFLSGYYATADLNESVRYVLGLDDQLKQKIHKLNELLEVVQLILKSDPDPRQLRDILRQVDSLKESA